MSGFGLYPTPLNSGQADFYRQRYWGLTDLASALNDYEWQQLIEHARQLSAQLPILAHAIRQKNQYAFGDAWIPQYRGNNPKWGEAAEDWLHNVWLPQCSYSGGCSDWQTDLFVSGVAWDIDGDDLALFVLDENNFPRIAYRSAHQIGSGGTGNEVKGGIFDGAKVCNGIIRDRNGRFLGVRLIRSKRSTDTDEPAYQDIPANQCDLQCEPMWRVQERGIPPLAVAVMDWLDVQDIKTFLKRCVKLESAIGVTHYNEHGEAAPNSDTLEERVDLTTNPTAVASDIKTEYRMGGEMIYMRANMGEKLESFRTDRPHSNSMEFMSGLERGGLLSVGWFRELVDPSAIGGASVRAIQDQARKSVDSRQKTMRRRAFRCIYFALSTAMNTGRLPKNNDLYDWMNWQFEMPAKLTVDQGYDEQADRENLAHGTTTLDAVSQKNGRWWQDTRAQRTIEASDLIDRALALQAEKNALIKDERDKLSLQACMDQIQKNSASESMGLRAEMSAAGNNEKPEKVTR